MSDNVGPIPEGEMDAFWGAVADAATSGRSGGYVGQIEIGFAWKIFVRKETGLSQTESMFPYEITSDKKTNDANSAAARALANKFVVQHGLEKDPSNVFYIRLFKDTIIGREVQWKDDRMQFLFPNSDAYNQVVMPHLRDAVSAVGEKRFGKWWARVSWMADPDQSRARDVQVKDSDGNVVVDPETGEPKMEKETVLVMYVSKLYRDKDEAVKDSGVATTDSILGSVAGDTEEEVTAERPDGYSEEDWTSTVAEIRTEFQNGTPTLKIAKVYDLPKKLIDAVVKDLVK